MVRRGMGRWEWSGGDEDRVMGMGWWNKSVVVVVVKM